MDLLYLKYFYYKINFRKKKKKFKFLFIFIKKNLYYQKKKIVLK